jgi:two-component system, chemotaxis family, response regulator Rcp1
MTPEPEVLLVEDNPGDARLYEKAFLRANPRARLHVASDGDAAQDFLFGNAQRPDLIVLDLNLPRRDGRELLAEIKKDQSLRRIPVIVITSSDARTDISQSYHLSANCLLTKPIALDEFLRTLDAAARFWLTVAQLPARR